MPMSQLETDFVAKLCALSKQVLADLLPRLANVNELYNSAGGIATTLTQAELDEVAALSGLTTTQVADTVFAFVAMKSALDAAFPAISQVGARFL